MQRGKKHVENMCEHEQTSLSVSRMRYQTPILKRLKPHEKQLETFQFLGYGSNDHSSDGCAR